jgi:hypothetical protein
MPVKEGEEDKSIWCFHLQDTTDLFLKSVVSNWNPSVKAISEGIT